MVVARPTRRQVLTVGALSAAGFSVGGFLWLPKPAENQNVFSAGELSIVSALGEVLFPEGNALGISWRDVNLASEVDILLGEYLDPKVVAPFRYLLRFVQYGTVAQAGKTFTACSPETRANLLESWGKPGSKYRNAGITSLKSVLGMAYFNHPEVLKAVGWRALCSAPVVQG
jgi:hypothetical protein